MVGKPPWRVPEGRPRLSSCIVGETLGSHVLYDLGGLSATWLLFNAQHKPISPELCVLIVAMLRRVCEEVPELGRRGQGF